MTGICEVPGPELFRAEWVLSAIRTEYFVDFPVFWDRLNLYAPFRRHSGIFWRYTGDFFFHCFRKCILLVNWPIKKVNLPFVYKYIINICIHIFTKYMKSMLFYLFKCSVFGDCFKCLDLFLILTHRLNKIRFISFLNAILHRNGWPHIWCEW